MCSKHQCQTPWPFVFSDSSLLKHQLTTSPVKGSPWGSSAWPSTHTLFSRQGNLLFLPLQHWDYWCVAPCSAFDTGSRTELPSPCACGECVTNGAISLAFVFILETGSCYVALASLQLTLYSRLVLNSWQSSCLSLPCSGITSMSHYTQLSLLDLAPFVKTISFLKS